ncbi:MAG: hypothetical protein Q8K92_09175 [Leadbetterella sp.]|nr:hypothetical protein [Leadbetterella sp.]
MNIITDYIIPIFSLFLSLVFFFLAWGNSKKTEEILKQINIATQTWQNDIMKYVSESLNSDPSIVGHKIYLSKLGSADNLTPIIQKLSDKLLDDSLTEEKKESIRKDIKMFLSFQNLFHQTSPTIGNSNPSVNADEQTNKKI